MNKLVFIFTLVLLAAGCATYSTKRSTFDGVWEGSGIQDNNISWTIKATIIGNRYSIDYPSLGCGGDMVSISYSENELKLRENLSYGQSKCIDGGTTVITKVGENQAQFTWFYPDGKKGATGTLVRR